MRQIALKAIARSTLPEADALVSAIILVPTIFSAEGADLEALIQGCADARQTRADQQLAEIGTITSLPANTRHLLKITILQRKNAD